MEFDEPPAVGDWIEVQWPCQSAADDYENQLVSSRAVIKTLFGCFILGVMLPSYVGIILIYNIWIPKSQPL